MLNMLNTDLSNIDAVVQIAVRSSATEQPNGEVRINRLMMRWWTAFDWCIYTENHTIYAYIESYSFLIISNIDITIYRKYQIPKTVNNIHSNSSWFS